MTWQADTVQFVIFSPATPSSPSAEVLWERVTATRPLSFQQGLGLPFGSNASGVIGQIGAVLQVQLDRVALVMSPHPAASFEAPPTIKNAEEAIAMGLPLAQKLAAMLPDVSRIAVVADANRPVADAAAALASLTAMTGVDVPGDALDFSLQFNRRRLAQTPGHSLNRLCRWQATMKQIFQLNQGATAPTSIREAHFAGLYVDVNTLPGKIAAGTGDDLFRELADEVRMLLDNAYVRLTV